MDDEAGVLPSLIISITHKAIMPLHVKVARAMYITFYTIIANYNEPSAAAQAHIHIATHINVSKCS